jgi:hypothetical protein
MRYLAAVAIATGLLLPKIAPAQQHKLFHVVEVKQYQSAPECFPSGAMIVCTVERWRVRGYTDTVEYELACWEATTTDKDGQTVRAVRCNPMVVGDDIEVRVFPSDIAYPPTTDPKKTPDYA